VPNILIRKPIALLQAEAEETEVQALVTHGGVPLKRTLSAWSLVSLGIGCIIGAGIFVLTGHAAATNAGPAIALSFVVGGIACAFAGLCYAEMASTVPIAGSAYTYAYATLGEFIAWIIGWDLILEYALGATTVAIGWSGYVVSFLRDLGIPISDQFATSPLAYDAATGVWSRTGALLNVPAMLIIVAISSLLVIGIRESSRVNNVIVVIKVAIVIAFIVAGIAFISSQNWVTAGNPEGAFIPPNQGPGIFGKARSSRRTKGPAFSAGAEFCAAPPSCSLPISASMRSRPRRRRLSTLSATCRSASSDRLVFVRCSMCW
jgi:APA family basic amino acid/polyamine antiporter